MKKKNEMIKIGQGSEAVVYLCYEARIRKKRAPTPTALRAGVVRLMAPSPPTFFHVGPRVIITARPWQCGRNRHHPPEDVDAKKESQVESSK